jgi:hypothetical protein
MPLLNLTFRGISVKKKQNPRAKRQESKEKLLEAV